MLCQNLPDITFAAFTFLQPAALRRALDLVHHLPQHLLLAAAKSPLAGKLLTSFLTSFNKRLKFLQASAAGPHTATDTHQRSDRGLTAAHLLTVLGTIAVTKQFITGTLINNREPVDTAAVRGTGKSSVSHPARTTTQSHLLVVIIKPVTTGHVTQSHLVIRTIDNITALNTLTASVTQTNIPEERRTLPTAVISNIGVTTQTIEAGGRTTGSAIAVDTDPVMIRPTGHQRLQTTPSS